MENKIKNIDEEFLKKLLFTGVVILFLNYPLLLYFSIKSGYPVSFLESQFSFSAMEIKSHFIGMEDHQITYYIYSQFSDFVYDVAHILNFFCLSILLIKSSTLNKLNTKIGIFLIFIGFIGTVFDFMENILIIQMSSNPSNFPDYMAPLHSYFASMKYLFWILQITWILIVGSYSYRNKMIKPFLFYSIWGVFFLQHWPTLITSLVLIKNLFT